MAFLRLAMITVSLLWGLAYGKDESRCTIYQGGCAFHVVLAGTDCMAGDAPAQMFGYTNQKAEPPSIQYGYQLSSTGPNSNSIDNKLLKEHIIAENNKEIIQEELKTNAKRFEELEKKLTNLMEGLSVRSLRHFRKIKSEITQVRDTVDQLKENGKKTKVNRNERSAKDCPPEYITTGTWTSCYSFSKFEANWREAREYCSASGSNLVSLESMKESYILDYLIKSDDYTPTDTWWTAGNYIPRMGRWMWDTRSQLRPMVYSRWAKGEPNSRSTNHCMVLHKETDYHWQDAMCTEKSKFICEYDKKR